MTSLGELNLQTMFVGRHYFLYSVVDSTNRQLRRLMRGEPSDYVPIKGPTAVARVPEGSVVVADYQTHGHGQQEAVWHSEPGKNLLLSLLLLPRFLEPRRQFALNEAIALSLYDLISPAFEEGSVYIKWPNDLVLHNKKVAGILIQNSLSANEMRSCIAGLGLNVEQLEFPPELPQATSLWREGAKLSRRFLLERFFTALERRYLQLRSGDFAGIRKDYLSALFRFDQVADYRRKDGSTFRGSILGVEPTGRLLIEHESGDIEAFAFKEVEFVY